MDGLPGQTPTRCAVRKVAANREIDERATRLAERIDDRHDPGIRPKITDAIMWTGISHRGICTCRMNELITRAGCANSRSADPIRRSAASPPPRAVPTAVLDRADPTARRPAVSDRCPIPDHEQLVDRAGAWAAPRRPVREQRRRTR
ncbi:hypothetical protein [Micromonospora sp. I033]